MESAFIPFMLLHQIAALLTLGGVFGFLFFVIKARFFLKKIDRNLRRKYILGMLASLLVAGLAISSVILVQVSFNVF